MFERLYYVDTQCTEYGDIVSVGIDYIHVGVITAAIRTDILAEAYLASFGPLEPGAVLNDYLFLQ
jgi:hypothetical protein